MRRLTPGCGTRQVSLAVLCGAAARGQYRALQKSNCRAYRGKPHGSATVVAGAALMRNLAKRVRAQLGLRRSRLEHSYRIGITVAPSVLVHGVSRWRPPGTTITPWRRVPSASLMGPREIDPPCDSKYKEARAAVGIAAIRASTRAFACRALGR